MGSDRFVCELSSLNSADKTMWLQMRTLLWPDSDVQDAIAWAARPDAVTLIARSHDGQGLVGFAEIGIRAYADGCESSPVAFLEGWYVDAEHRREGVGRHLLEAAAEWARTRGLHELASDSLLADTTAHLAHLAVGFQEVERSIKYRFELR